MRDLTNYMQAALFGSTRIIWLEHVRRLAHPAPLLSELWVDISGHGQEFARTITKP